MRIFIIADNEYILKDISKALRPVFENCFVASGPRIALELYRNNINSEAEKFSVVIADIMMPGLNSLDIVNEIGKINVNAFVISISPNTENKFTPLLNRNQLYILRKPFNFDTLMNYLKEIEQRLFSQSPQ